MLTNDNPTIKTMRKLEAWYRRKFCDTLTYYGEKPLQIGEVFYKSINGELEYVYVGKNKIWINKSKQK